MYEMSSKNLWSQSGLVSENWTCDVIMIIKQNFKGLVGYSQK